MKHLKSRKDFINEQVQHPGEDRVRELCAEYGVTMSDAEVRSWMHADNEETVRTVCIIKTFDDNELNMLLKYIKSGKKDQAEIDFFLDKGLEISEYWKDGYFPFGNPNWYKDRIKENMT
jgi:hypothetical protein